MLEGLAGTIDLIVPRGGKSLVAKVQEDARVPVFSHLEGICHVYIDKSAHRATWRVAIAVNAKMRRTGICGAAEAILIDRSRQGAASQAGHRCLASRLDAKFAATVKRKRPTDG